MSEPEQRLPGATYFMTMVCDRRQSRLVPTEETNAAFAVAFAEAQARYGIVLVAVTTIPNHYHAVVYDPFGRMTEFMRDAHALMARWGSARDGVRGVGFWDRQGAALQLLGDVDAIVKKVAYTIANPVTSFLVRRPEDWRGVGTRVDDLGRWRGAVYRRPEGFFEPGTWVSEEVELASELPPMVTGAGVGPDRFQKRVRAEVERLVAAAHAAAAERGHGFMGMDKVLSLSVWDQPDKESPRQAGRGAAARKRVDASRRSLQAQMARALVAFRKAHRGALERFRAGLEVVFPEGTWQAWRSYGARRDDVVAPWSWAPS